MEEEDKLFAEAQNINISQIVRSHISELRVYASKEAQTIKELEQRVQKFAQSSGLMRNFLEEKGLMIEFQKWREEQNVPVVN